MPPCNPPQLRRTVLTLGAALLTTIFGAPSSVPAQQLIASNSFPSPSNSSPSNSTLSNPNPASPNSSNESATLTLHPASDLPDVLPDAPGYLLQDPQTPTATPATLQTNNPDAVSPNGTQQTKRVLGIVPNFRSVSADVKLPPQTAKEKFVAAGKDTFDYSSLIVAGIQAGFAMNSASYPQFHQGLKGYGRYYWHTLADTASENFMVGGVGPVVFKQDNRFYTLGHGGFRKRAGYAVTRVLISRKDDGDATFNFAEVIGSGAAAGASTLYYPTQYRTWTKVGQKWLTSDLIDSFNFFWKEFWPDVNKKVFHTH
jgi:hypothetical protein